MSQDICTTDMDIPYSPEKTLPMRYSGEQDVKQSNTKMLTPHSILSHVSYLRNDTRLSSMELICNMHIENRRTNLSGPTYQHSASISSQMIQQHRNALQGDEKIPMIRQTCSVPVRMRPFKHSRQVLISQGKTKSYLQFDPMKMFLIL